MSLHPLGAGRLTASYISHDPPKRKEIRALRRHARREIGEVAGRLRWEGAPSKVVATSKTFKQLARLGGAAPESIGPFVDRAVTRDDIAKWANRLARMNRRKRGAQHGVARSRRDQIVAGAYVALAAMRALDVDRVEICPWAVREGVLLRRLDALRDPHEEHDKQFIADATALNRP